MESEHGGMAVTGGWGGGGRKGRGEGRKVWHGGGWGWGKKDGSESWGWLGGRGWGGGGKVEHGVNTVEVRGEGRRGGGSCGWVGEEGGQSKVKHRGRGGGERESWGGGESGGGGVLNMVEVRVGEERGGVKIGLGWKEAVHTRYRIPACIFPCGWKIMITQTLCIDMSNFLFASQCYRILFWSKHRRCV